MILCEGVHLTGDATVDILVMVISGGVGAVGAVLWYLLRRSISAVDKRQDACDEITTKHTALLSADHARISVLEERTKAHHSHD